MVQKPCLEAEETWPGQSGVRPSVVFHNNQIPIFSRFFGSSKTNFLTLFQFFHAFSAGCNCFPFPVVFGAVDWLDVLPSSAPIHHPIVAMEVGQFPPAIAGTFCARRDNGVFGVLPTVCVAKVLELFIPVFATGRAETPDPGMAFPEASGCLIIGGIGIKPAPDGIYLQGLDPLGDGVWYRPSRSHSDGGSSGRANTNRASRALSINRAGLSPRRDNQNRPRSFFDPRGIPLKEWSGSIPRSSAPAGSRLASRVTNIALTRLLRSPSSLDAQGRHGSGIPCSASSSRWTPSWLLQKRDCLERKE